MSSIPSLRALLVDEVKDLYHAETQLLGALPKMAKAATSPELKAGFTSHLKQTRGHVSRLEEAMSLLDVPLKGKTCHAMKGLIKEGDEAIEADGPAPVRDAALIGAAQRVEHYEIAAYGTARTFASTVGEKGVADLLQATLEEEAETDRVLSELAASINGEALAAGEETPAARKSAKS